MTTSSPPFAQYGKEAPKYTLVDILKLMQDSTKVIVGKIRGHCTGGGVGVAAACDISVISSECQLGFTEVLVACARIRERTRLCYLLEGELFV